MRHRANRSRVAKWIIWSAFFWTGLGLFFAVQLRFAGLPWRDALDWSLARAYSWGVLTPAIFGLDRRLVDRLALGWRILLHVPLGIGWTVAAILLRLTARPLRGASLPDNVFVFFAERFVPDFTIYAAIASVSMVRAYAGQMKARVAEAQERAFALERRLAEAQLHNLRSQLQPHFLFNALNTISALTESDPALARRLMARLGDLLRASLAHTAHAIVTLGEEATFLDDYLSIESARFEDRITVSVDVDEDAVDDPVPSFLLQPLVENAIRHGLAPLPAGGHIDVSAKRHGNTLAVSVRDNGAGLPSGWDIHRTAGVGLSNLRARLATLYGRDDLLTVSRRPEGGVDVRVTLPLDPGAEATRDRGERAAHHR